MYTIIAGIGFLVVCGILWYALTILKEAKSVSAYFDDDDDIF